MALVANCLRRWFGHPRRRKTRSRERPLRLSYARPLTSALPAAGRKRAAGSDAIENGVRFNGANLPTDTLTRSEQRASHRILRARQTVTQHFDLSAVGRGFLDHISYCFTDKIRDRGGRSHR